MKDKQPPKEEKNKVPAYIVTFSDMITLLLTFFVLLLSMATEQIEDAKFERGRDALIKAMNNIGLKGIASSDKNTREIGEDATLNPVDKDEKFTEEQALDITEEAIRRIFKELEQRMKITPAQITGKEANFSPTSIKFKKGMSSLSQKDARFLENFADTLYNSSAQQNLTIYIVGTAPEENDLKNQCIISANRALAVADKLRKSLPKGIKWNIHSWGAGPGGLWKTNGPIENAHITIAVLGN